MRYVFAKDDWIVFLLQKKLSASAFKAYLLLLLLENSKGLMMDDGFFCIQGADTSDRLFFAVAAIVNSSHQIWKLIPNILWVELLVV